MQATDSAAMVVEKPRKKHELLHSLRKFAACFPQITNLTAKRPMRGGNGMIRNER